jgi:hypothetical protein
MIDADSIASQVQLSFLWHCYRFDNEKWPHADRDLSSDQGFEKQFREYCVTHLDAWVISQHREMHLGGELSTASGILHEIDIVAQHRELTAVLELKNQQSSTPGKNDVIIFFAKLFDYLALNPVLTLKEVCPVFMTSSSFEVNTLAACLGLGIHPIGHRLRPLPLLVDCAERMEFEFKCGCIRSDTLRSEVDDFRAGVNALCLALDQTWVSSRCGYQAEDRIVLRALPEIETPELSHRIRVLNADCTDLLTLLKKQKQLNAQ